MENWIRVNDMKYANHCSICGKDIEVGGRGWLSRHGEMNRKTGKPKWVCHCFYCHTDYRADTPSPSEQIMAQADMVDIDDINADELAKTLDAINEIKENEEISKPEPEHEPYSIPWIKEHAEWGV